MKRLSIVLALAMVFLIGCISGGPTPEITIEIGNAEKELVAKIAARRVGSEVQKRYPDVAVEVLALSKGLLVSEENETAKIIFDQIVFVLSSETISDPLLAMDIQDLIGLINIKANVEITEDYLIIGRAVAKGLIQGIESEKSYGR